MKAKITVISTQNRNEEGEKAYFQINQHGRKLFSVKCCFLQNFTMSNNCGASIVFHVCLRFEHVSEKCTCVTKKNNIVVMRWIERSDPHSWVIPDLTLAFSGDRRELMLSVGLATVSLTVISFLWCWNFRRNNNSSMLARSPISVISASWFKESRSKLWIIT